MKEISNDINWLEETITAWVSHMKEMAFKLEDIVEW